MEGTNEIAESSSRFQGSRAIQYIQPSELICPKSQYARYTAPLPLCDEKRAIEELAPETQKQSLTNPETRHGKKSNLPAETCFTEYKLSNFVIYLPDDKYYPYEFRSLQELTNRTGHSSFLFDGILTAGKVQRYVQAVPFQTLSIGNYGQDHHEVGDYIWIKSDFNSKSDVYYRLNSPAPEYARFYHGFKWLANFAKHFVDYCEVAMKDHEEVSIHHFCQDFSQWVQKKHHKSAQFQEWYGKYQGHDFRRAVAANINFLWKESQGVASNIQSHPIWSQVMDADYIPLQPREVTETIVTPYIYDCFKQLKFGYLLKAVSPASNMLELRASRGIGLDACRTVTDSNAGGVAARDVTAERQPKIQAVRVGDVLSVVKDGAGSIWRDETSRYKTVEDCWYLYVQEAHQIRTSRRSFTGIWLYSPEHTCCAKMKYPYPNELFFSDNCTCSTGRIPEEEVLDVVKVLWHGNPRVSRRDLVVRQTYLEHERFVVLRDAHKECQHLKQRSIQAKQNIYQVGQTVLAPAFEQGPKRGLEPCEVLGYARDGSQILIILRRLLRRVEIRGEDRCRPNELVYTDKTYKIEAAAITRTCLVRFYTQSEAVARLIPAPYGRDGTGNAFYITTRLAVENGERRLIPIYDNFPQSLIEGFDPLERVPGILRGLDLYCGGGNFGRGLEEGGALCNKYAVDYAGNQIHTYFANLKHSSATKLFYGSVDDQLYQALQGNPKGSDLIPLPGEIDFISAGSPCQGFTVINMRRNNEKGLKNQSLIASVAAYVDFYRPKYGILENVINMAQSGPGRDEDVLSQLICSLVGLGYQLEIFLIDAWSCGSPQSRSRLFVSFAAPDCEPLRHPDLSHSHPPKVRDRGFGKLASGDPFGRRIRGPTPFDYVTSGEASNDLPDIRDGKPHQCIPHPDHVVPIGVTNKLRHQILAIPLFPRGQNFVSAWAGGQGSMSKEQRALFPDKTKIGKPCQRTQQTSKAWGRVDPRSLFQTVVVSQSPADARMGRSLHWDQQRPLTVMEARRAQGFPDEEVLLGSPVERWKIIGNSVARSVSLALGLALREAWLKKPLENDVPPVISSQRARPNHRYPWNKTGEIGPKEVIPDSEESDDSERSAPEPDRRSIAIFASRTTSANQDHKPCAMNFACRPPDKTKKSLKRSRSKLENSSTSSLGSARKAAKRSSDVTSSYTSRSLGLRLRTPLGVEEVLSNQETENLDHLSDDVDDKNDDNVKA